MAKISAERWLIVAFAILFLVSFVTALIVLVLGLPFKLLPDEASARGQVSQALSTVFALAMGLIAILVALRVESASFKATQEVRRWLNVLISELLAMSRSTALYQGTGGIKAHKKQPDYRDFRGAMRAIHAAPTALAMTYWISSIHVDIEKGSRPREWRLFFIRLSELERVADYTNASHKMALLLSLLSTLKPADVKRIASYVHNLDKTLGTLPDVIAGDILVSGQLAYEKEQEEERNPNNLNAIFRFIKSKGVSDPTLDLFIACTGDFDDADGAKAALDAGADPSATTGLMLSKYADYVREFKQSTDQDS